MIIHRFCLQIPIALSLHVSSKTPPYIKMSEQQIQLEINVNIGSQKYLIKVPKDAEPAQIIRSFLATHRLNAKYQGPIIRMVQDRLRHQEHATQPQPQQYPQPQEESKGDEVSRQLQENRSSLSSSSQLQENSSRTVNSCIKSQILSKIKKELQFPQEQPKDPKNMYEQWRVKQKQKNHSKSPQPSKSNEQSRLTQATRESHSPDHFYKKGQEFKQTCELNSENEFKKLYPFKLHNKGISQAEQNKLYNRLHKQKKDLHAKTYLSREGQGQLARTATQSHLEVDPIKLKLKQKDAQVDRILYCMIKDGQLSYTKHQSRSKSPFRKTITY